MALDVRASDALAAALARFDQAAAGVSRAFATPQPPPPRIDAAPCEGAGDCPGPAELYGRRGRLLAADPPADPAGAIAELAAARRDVEVDARVLQRAYEATGTLLDVLA